MQLIICCNSIIPIFIKRPDPDARILRNKTDHLLTDIFDVVVLFQEADVRLDCVFWVSAGVLSGCVSG